MRWWLSLGLFGLVLSQCIGDKLEDPEGEGDSDANADTDGDTDAASDSDSDSDSDSGADTASEGDADCDHVLSYFGECEVDEEEEERMEECCEAAEALFDDGVAADFYGCLVEVDCDTLAADPVETRGECLMGLVGDIEPSDAHDALAEAHCHHDHERCGGGEYDDCVSAYFSEEDASDDALISLWLKEDIVEEIAGCFEDLSDSDADCEDGMDLCFDGIIYEVADGEVCWGGDED
jgi:hypothetical protein